MERKSIESILQENNMLRLIEAILKEKPVVSNEIEKEVVQKKFNPYITNRFLSFITDVNIISKIVYVFNRYGFTPVEYRDILYDLYVLLLPEKKEYKMLKYIKKKTEYPDWFFNIFRKVLKNPFLSKDDIIRIYEKMLEENEEKVAKILITNFSGDKKELVKYFPFLSRHVKTSKKKNSELIKELSEAIKKQDMSEVKRLF